MAQNRLASESLWTAASWSAFALTIAILAVGFFQAEPDATAMVPVPAGLVVDECSDADCSATRRSVRLPGFLIDRAEVTVRQYRRCVEAGGCSILGLQRSSVGGPSGLRDVTSEHCHWGRLGRDDRPINCVSWTQADTYCRWAGKRLPTRDEWRHAAADARRRDRKPDRGLIRRLWILAGPPELVDMSGSVSEWTADSVLNRRGLVEVLGASWAREGSRGRSAPLSLFHRDMATGFRCAR